MMFRNRVAWKVAAALYAAASAAGAAGCKSGDTSPSPTTTPVAGTTITITASGVSPKDIMVTRGSQVTFVNSDSRDHQMNSDPHPTHGECPELDNVGFLVPGQRRQTGNLNTPRRCGFHDHLNDGNASLKGTITIQ